jgi:pyruvate/2-oxoglutarate dehydrogenase complex dihydrolipoamide dehydrogenase (E3) component
VTDKKGRILGATIAGYDAGEIIQIWSLAVAQGMNIKALTEWVAPYPTLGEISKEAAGRFGPGASSVMRKLTSYLTRMG